jgi:hypothetical protein
MSGKVYSGKDFKALYPNRTYVKLTNEFENHNGMQFQTGINTDILPFIGERECLPGGWYICPYEDLTRWIIYRNTTIKYWRMVDIPDDANVYDESSDKVKVDYAILSERHLISDLFDDPDFCLESVKKYGSTLRHITKQTPEMCLEAIKQDPFTIQYVIDQTPEICLEAVKRNGVTLMKVKCQSLEICLEAVKQCGKNLCYVDITHKTPEICLEAVKQNGKYLSYVDDDIQTIDLCLVALKQCKESGSDYCPRIKSLEMAEQCYDLLKTQ